MDTRDLILIGAALILWVKYEQDREAPEQSESIEDALMTKVDEATAAVNEAMGVRSPVADMFTSDAMLTMLKRRESLSLKRYALGDGGYTWGYGHFEKDPNAFPETITRQFAEELFVSDVEKRAEKWVKLYIKVDLTQNEFDALVSIAFNMSPQSFKKFANEVNAGNGIAAMAENSVAWVADKFKNGISNRRMEEINVFENGVYA